MSRNTGPSTKLRRRQSDRRARQKLAASGICSSCRKRKVHIRATCYRCLLQKLAGRHLLDRAKWKELHYLYERQAGRCFYTKEPISIGENATIDHILPAARFPLRTADVSNLCWASQEVNRMKSDMTMDEFIKRCRQILINFGYEVGK